MQLLAQFLMTLAPLQVPPIDAPPVDAERRAAAEAERELTGARPPAPLPASFSVSAIQEQAVGVGAHPDGSLVASGRTWLARWAGERFDFSTRIADPESAAPALSLRLERLGRAGIPASLGPESAPQLEAGDDAQVRVRRAVAPGVEERWDARREGVELSYVFAERPPGTGDLLVSLAVDTALEAPRGRGHSADGLDFTDPAGTGIHVGAVTALDAAGRTARGWLGWDGQRLSFGVPADFVDACTFPLTVDPVFSGLVTIFGTSPADGAPVVAWDDAGSTWAVAWSRSIPGSDFPWMILVQRLYSWGGLQGPAQVLESGHSAGWDVFHGRRDLLRIVDVTGPDLFVVAAATEPRYGYSGSVLHWFPVKPGKGFLGAGKTDALAINGVLSDIDLGTDPLSGYPNFLTVWSESSAGGFSALSTVDPTGRVSGWGAGGSGVVKLTSDTFGGGAAGQIAVSTSAGPSGYWLVAWSGTNTPADPRLGGRVVSYYGAPVTGEVVIDSVAWPKVFNGLSVAGDGSEFFVGYTYHSGGQTLLVQRCALGYSGGWSLSADPSPAYLDSFPYPSVSGSGVEARCRIERVGDEYVAAWLRRTGTGGWTVRAASIASTHAPIHGTPLVIPDYYSEGRYLHLGSQSAAKAYPASGDKGMIVAEGSAGLLRMFVEQ